MKATLCTLLVLLAGAAFPAAAQAPQSAPMTGMTMTPAGAGASPSTQAFKAADDKMMHDMAGPMTGDPDRDFVGGMLPHHQGAVDMAKIELQYGKDPAMRRLATGIIKAQETEIALMSAWQTKHGASH